MINILFSPQTAIMRPALCGAGRRMLRVHSLHQVARPQQQRHFIDSHGVKILATIVSIRCNGWSEYMLNRDPTVSQRPNHATMDTTAAVLSNDTEVVDDQPCKIKQALRDGTLSFGFSAGGLLFPYYAGALYCLQELGIVTERTKLGGASAGSLIAACFHAGMSRNEVLEDCLRLAHDCRTNGTRGRLGPVLRKSLEASLPSDAHERCTNAAYVAVTKAFPTPSAVLLSEYTSRADLIDALLTSCHIPFWMDGKVLTTFRDALHYDGGVSNFIPIPPQTEGVRVCVFPSSQLSTVSGIAISPDSYGPWPHDLGQMLSWAFEPAPEETLLHLVERGARDAAAWARHRGLVDDPQQAQRAQHNAAQQPPASPSAVEQEEGEEGERRRAESM